MDVPNKWALDDFLNLAAKILKQHGLSRRIQWDCSQSLCGNPTRMSRHVYVSLYIYMYVY